MTAEKAEQYEIQFTAGAADDLAALRPFNRKPILEAIDEQLTVQPLETTRNKKVLLGLVPPWEYSPPLRELRVGDYRVFYDVDQASHLSVVRAVRKKPAEKRTEDIL